MIKIQIDDDFKVFYIYIFFKDTKAQLKTIKF